MDNHPVFDTADEFSDMLQREHRLERLVRIMGIVIAILLVVFFGVIVRSSILISNQVQYVRDTPYPVSVCAGHIETDLVHLRAYFDGALFPKPASKAVEGYLKENPIKEIMDDLHKQIDMIAEAGVKDERNLTGFYNLLNLLDMRSKSFAEMCRGYDGSEASYETLCTYLIGQLYPVIDALGETNDYALQATSTDIDAVYEDVSESNSIMLYFTVAIALAIILAAFSFMSLIATKNKLEKELRASLTDAMEEILAANKAKTDFLANMSHDIRTPMNAIVGLTQIASENIDDTLRVRQCLTRITTSSRHLLSLINDVLDMNKIESGKVTLTNEEFSLKGLADEIDTIFQSQPASQKRKSEVRLVGIFADKLLGDAMRLRQILLNLTSNALKYTNEGDVTRMTIKEDRSRKEGYASVTFIVEDTGIGMKQEFINHIFEPFERERNDFTNFTEGTGLGMAITKNLVDLMGGTIHVESELGMGTTVTMKVDFKIAEDQGPDAFVGTEILASNTPVKGRAGERNGETSDGEGTLASGKSGADASSASAQPGVHGGEHASHHSAKPNKINVSGRILVVEDNEINMDIAKQLISSRGATVDEAFDGLEAVSKVSDSPDGTYDLIFMDWQMPHMNGLEATVSIRKFLDERGRKQIPIVAMTANAFDSDRQQALEAGMNDFMAKPIDIHQLEGVLKKYLDS